jgi:CBS domain-containing membrane protein
LNGRRHYAATFIFLRGDFCDNFASHFKLLSSNMIDFLRLFLPHHSTVTFAEKLRAGLAGGIAILWVGLLFEFIPHAHYPLLILASMGASAVLLFAAPHSPMAQPWNLVIGHIVSALAGWLISYVVKDFVVAAALSVALSILFMHLLDALHPPGAATALGIVLSSGQFHTMGANQFTLLLILNIGTLLTLALIINNLLPGRRYPMPPAPTTPKTHYIPLGALTVDDIRQALAGKDSVIDVSEDELLEIANQAVQHAYQRGAAK